MMLADILGILGFGLAAIGLYLRQQDRRPKLQVGIFFEDFETGSPNDEYPSQDIEAFVITITNASQMPIRVETIKLVWGNIWGKTVSDLPEEIDGVMVKPEGAFKLEQYQSRKSFALPTYELEKWLQRKGAPRKTRIKARIIDSLEKKYDSRKLTINVPEKA